MSFFAFAFRRFRRFLLSPCLPLLCRYATPPQPYAKRYLIDTLMLMRATLSYAADAMLIRLLAYYARHCCIVTRLLLRYMLLRHTPRRCRLRYFMPARLRCLF